MKILVTGGTGFIGKHLIQALLHTEHQVVCLARSASRAEPLQRAGVTVALGDITDRQAVLAAMRGCDWVFNLANLYAMWYPDKAEFTRVNVKGTHNVMTCALEAGVKKVVHVSTAAVYGKPKDCPFTEESQPGPVLFSEYARTKARADADAWKLYRDQGLPLVMLHPGIVLGAGDDKASGRYIQDIINRKVPSTIFHHSACTYVYVGDVVTAILRAAEKPDNIGERYLIGKHQLNGRDYAHLISDIAQVPLPWLPYPDFVVLAAGVLLTLVSSLTKKFPHWGLAVDSGRTLKAGFRYDGSKAERELGLRYTPIRAALQEAIASYQKEEKQVVYAVLDRNPNR